MMYKYSIVTKSTSPFQNQINQTPTITQPIAPSTPTWETFVKPFEGQITAAFLLSIILIYNFTIEPWIKKQSYKISFSKKQDEDIEQILTELRVLTGCDRVLLSLFTNGTNTISGMSIKGCRTTHEVADIGLEKITGAVNVRIDPYSHFIFQSLVKTPFRKRIAQDIKDSSYRLFLTEVQAVYSINYFLSADDLPLGFITLHWRSLNSRMDFEAVSETEIGRFADAISSRLLSRQNLVSKLKTLIPKGRSLIN